MTLDIPFDEIIKAVHAHTALMAIGARHLPEQRIPAILHSDHNRALMRVAVDAASIVSSHLCLDGCRDLILDSDSAGILVVYDPGLFPLAASSLRSMLVQAVKSVILHIAYTAAGYSSDFADREREITRTLAGTRRLPIPVITPHW